MRSLLLLPVLLAASTLAAQTPAHQPAASPAPPELISPKTPMKLVPSHESTEAQVREYFTLLHLDTIMNQVVNQLFDTMQKASPPYIPDDVWMDMKQSFSRIDVIAEFVPIYQRHVTKEDMDAVLAFYRSDAGFHLLAVQQVMSTESQAHFREIGMRLGEEVAERHKDEIAAAQKKYEEKIAAKQGINVN